jgi:hypothetical protein
MTDDDKIGGSELRRDDLPLCHLHEEKESATSKVERVKAILRGLYYCEYGYSCPHVNLELNDSAAKQILDIVRKQDERIASLEETIEILSDKGAMKSLERGVESAREHGSRPYKAKQK